MNPNAEKWPYPNDTALGRARRIALAYRAALGANNRTLRDTIDDAMAAYGETWIRNPDIVTDPDGMDTVTTKEAAALVHVAPYEIRRWACQKHPQDPEKMLLPRFGKRGRERTYLVAAVVAAAEYTRGNVALPQVDTRGAGLRICRA